MTAQHIINHFKLIFSEYGWPDILVSDNGPYYSSEAFTKMMQEYNMNHITSSPHYPQSNGLAENFVQIVENLFHKATEEGTDIFKVLMIYRNTPLSNNLQSPMQMLQSRTMRSQLPMSNVARQQLGFRQRSLESRQKLNTYHCMRIKTKNEYFSLHDLCLGQHVMMLDPTSKRWSPAVITRLCKEPRSFKSPQKKG